MKRYNRRGDRDDDDNDGMIVIIINIKHITNNIKIMNIVKIELF